jgi:hypothetical protein
MGTFSTPQSFYLIDGNELVNVNQQINYNWQRADDRIKPLVEYLPTDVSSITDSSLIRETGFKWYKKWSNSIFYYRDGLILEDVNCKVDTWSFSGITFETGYGSLDSDKSRIGYSISDNFVRWRGRLVLNGTANDLPLNTTVDFMTPPDSALPARSKYFTVYGGDAGGGSNYQIFRVFVPAVSSGDKRVEFIKYGAAAITTGERYLSLNDIYYSLDD